MNNPVNLLDRNGKWPERIHDHILDKAFGGILTNDQISILKQASVFVDTHQGVNDSYLHEMSAPGQTVNDAEGLMSCYIQTQEDRATEKLGEVKFNDALYEVGQALHPIMDATSPSHTGFQVWREPGENVFNAALAVEHFMLEFNISPGQLETTANAVKEEYSKVILQNFVNELTGVNL